MGVTADGRFATSVLTEDGERVFGSKLTESGIFVFGLGGAIAYTDGPSFTFKVLPTATSLAVYGDVPSLIVRFLVALNQGFADQPALSIILRPDVKAERIYIDDVNALVVFRPDVFDIPNAGSLEAPNVTFRLIPSSATTAGFVEKPGLTARFRLDVTNGLLFSEVLQAVWNESASVLLDPELLAPVWTAENVLTEGVFGFPGIRNRIQTVRSKVTVQ